MSESLVRSGATVPSRNTGGGMTSRELLWLLLRRWYLVIVGMAITLVVLWPATHRPGVYWAQVNVLLLPPTYEYFPNKLEDPQYSLAALAGLIVSDFNGSDRPNLVASADTTLYGEGVRSGAQVRIPNLGSQWNLQYTSPTIDVQVVSNAPDTTIQEIEGITNELQHLLEERQDQLQIAPSMRATALVAPSVPSVYYIAGSKTRALGAGAVVGFAMTTAGIYWFERLIGSTRSRSKRNRLHPNMTTRQNQEQLV